MYGRMEPNSSARIGHQPKYCTDVSFYSSIFGILEKYFNKCTKHAEVFLMQINISHVATQVVYLY